MIRSASHFLFITLLALLAIHVRAEKVADVLDSNSPTKPTNTAQTAATPAIPLIKVDPSGKVDEPDFKASVKVRGNPTPNYDPVSKSNNAIAVPISPWAVPEEDGHPAPVKPAAPGDKVAITTEDISPSLAAIIAREKNGTKLSEMIPELQAIVAADDQ